jgi:hypothetical protein
MRGGDIIMSRRLNRMEGLFFILDRKNEQGLAHWSEELRKRGIPGVILLDEYTVDNHRYLVRNISKQGFDIGLIFNEGPFWDDNYDAQFEIMNRITEKVRLCIENPLRLFGSKYFAYNESTLQIAEKLGIEYIPARGTTGAKAMVYKPEEYKTTLISVSNVPSKELGTGSLCDESLRSRSETPEGFRDILFNINEERIVLVAQTHLSGVKLKWWNVYQEYFRSDTVLWQSLDDFAADPLVLPLAQIPINTRADYREPKPRIPLEEETDFPFT